jgi:hypothetical protein
MRRRARCIIDGAPLWAKERCKTCYEYRRRHGHDRPFDLIRRLTEQDIENELACNRERFAS